MKELEGLLDEYERFVRTTAEATEETYRKQQNLLASLQKNHGISLPPHIHHQRARQMKGAHEIKDDLTMRLVNFKRSYGSIVGVFENGEAITKQWHLLKQPEDKYIDLQRSYYALSARGGIIEIQTGETEEIADTFVGAINHNQTPYFVTKDAHIYTYPEKSIHSRYSARTIRRDYLEGDTVIGIGSDEDGLILRTSKKQVHLESGKVSDLEYGEYKEYAASIPFHDDEGEVLARFDVRSDGFVFLNHPRPTYSLIPLDRAAKDS